MKSKSCKKQKITPLKLTIIISAIILIGISAWLAIRLIQVSDTSSMTVQMLAEKSTTAMNEYNQSVLVLDTQQIVGENKVVAEYVLTTSKDSSYRTYMYRDDNEDMYQCWELNAETGMYDIYIYDNSFEVWVKSSLEYEPLSSDTWMVTQNLDNYTLLKDTDMWGEDECYVVQITGESEELSVIYEEIYIRCSDFLPRGIISYGVSDTEQSRIDTLDPANFEEFSAESAMIESSTFIEVISVYSLEFSNDDLSLFQKPEHFVTDAEYMEFLNQVESEEVKDGETDN